MNRQEKEKYFLEIYDNNADALFRYCYFKTFDRDVSKDTVQETFMRIWNQLAEDKEILSPKAFMYTIAGNLIKDLWKKKRAIPLGQMEKEDDGEPFDIPDDNQDHIIDAEVKLAVRSLGKLSESDREIMTLRFVDGLSPKDIAHILGERENTVAVRLSRAVERLKKIVGDNI